MKLLSHYSLLHRVSAADPVLPDLKPIIERWTGQRIRRIDHYIELCLAGGLSCVAKRSLPADTGIYLATLCGAVATSAAAMQSIFASGESPKPLHFVNTLGNSAGFYLTQLLGVTGNLVVVSQEQFSFESALLHAWMDLQAGRVSCALVGAFDEVVLPLERHAQRLQMEGAQWFTEGSHWLLLVPDGEGEAGVRVHCPVYAEDPPALQEWLRQQAPVQVRAGFDPSPDEREWLPVSSVHSVGGKDVAFHGVFSAATLTGLVADLQESGGRGIHVMRDKAGRYCAVSVEAAL